MLTLSGPVELLFLLCFIAAWTCVVVVCSLSVFLPMCLFVLCVLYLTVLVNCLLNAFAICVGEVNGFSLKVMVLFWVVFFLYVCCACDPSVCLGLPSICQICVFV